MLEWINSILYLGVKITRKLCWSDNISSAAAKANHVLGFLRRSMYGSSKEVKKRVLVHPRLEYCSYVSNPHLKKDCDKFERVQKWATRSAYCQWDHHTYTWSLTYEEACKHLKLKTLESRRMMLSLCQVYKIIHNLDCIPWPVLSCIIPTLFAYFLECHPYIYLQFYNFLSIMKQAHSFDLTVTWQS